MNMYIKFECFGVISKVEFVLVNYILIVLGVRVYYIIYVS